MGKSIFLFFTIIVSLGIADNLNEQKKNIDKASLYFRNAMYDRSLEILKGLNLKDFDLLAAQDPEARRFAIKARLFEALNYYHLIDKTMAEKRITEVNTYLERVVADAQAKDFQLVGLRNEEVLRRLGLFRYWILAQMVSQDLATWKDKDLAEVERLMRYSGETIDPDPLPQGSEKRDEIVEQKMKEKQENLKKADAAQKKAIKILDDMIKQLEDKQNQQANNNSSKPNDPNDPNKQNKPEGGQQKPANETIVMGGKGNGKVDEKQLRQIAEQWGTMPPEKRAQVVQEITRDLPERFRPLIEEYFKALNRYYPKN